ncbi:MAG: hypothetical protein GF401_01870 [Chitinivibrionales bacterium]|nr:hypothetical protein [Chitinivibrionales bacterium]
MKRYSSTFIALALCLFAVSCGSKKIKRGDRFEVLTEMREEATMRWDQPYTNSFNCIIPQGTVLEVTMAPPAGAEFLEVEVVSVNGNSNKEFIEEKIVPDHIRHRKGYEGFYLSIPRKYVGEKIQKVE